MSMRTEVQRFVVVGVVTNSVNFSAYWLLNRFDISLFIASLVGYSLGLLLSYHFGRIWVFGEKFASNTQNIIRFVTIYAAGGLGMSLIIILLTNQFGLDYFLSWLIGAAFAVVNNFAGQKIFVFRKGESGHGQ